jgi:signal transduction histidine kinase
MKKEGRWHSAVHRHRMAVDVVIAVTVLFGVFVAASKHTEANWATGHQTGPVIALEFLVFIGLLLRRKRPVKALIVIVAASTVVMLLVKGWSPIAVVAVIAVFTVAVTRDRRTAAIAGLGSGLCLVFGGALRTGDWLTSDSVSTLAWTGFAAALGQAIQSQKAYVAEVEERALRAEQTREEEALRRVIEERLRIARELHDVVAHHIAVIQVQSGVVDHLLTESPTAAREALGHVRRSSKMVLDELGDMLDVLRQPDDPITPTDPAPGLNRLVGLIDDFAASGLKVDWRISGAPLALPTAVDLVAYRLVQEGLTNAHKHGTGSAELVLGFDPAGLEISVLNPVVPAVDRVLVGGGRPDSVAPSLGHGLSGMRERAHAVGGVVSATLQEDGCTWRVWARMPLPENVSRSTGESIPDETTDGAAGTTDGKTDGKTAGTTIAADGPACRRWPS